MKNPRLRPEVPGIYGFYSSYGTPNFRRWDGNYWYAGFHSVKKALNSQNQTYRLSEDTLLYDFKQGCTMKLEHALEVSRPVQPQLELFE